jgi:hypothetical protein
MAALTDANFKPPHLRVNLEASRNPTTSLVSLIGTDRSLLDESTAVGFAPGGPDS